MYPAAFAYHAPTSLRDALALLAELQDRAKPLAGGHSLIPMMKLRLAQPEHLIDLRKLPGLAGIREADGILAIGAATTHWAVESSSLLAERLPLLTEVAGMIADPQVRNRGTIGGSLAHADPAADYPATMLALGAELVCESLAGQRIVKADDWFQGVMTTALRADELLTEIRIALPPTGAGAAYIKHPHPATRFAICGVAALLTTDRQGRCTGARLGLTGIAPNAVRLTAVEQALTGKRLDAAAIAAAAEHAPDGVDIQPDRLASSDDKIALCRTFAQRALTQAAARTRE